MSRWQNLDDKIQNKASFKLKLLKVQVEPLNMDAFQNTLCILKYLFMLI